MAGHGPPPAEVKRRRNKPPEFDELPAEGNSGPYPPLPASYGVEVPVEDEDPATGDKVIRMKRKQVKFLHDTREWYETWATSPMATKFTGVDWNRLKRVAILADAFHRSPSQALAGELRLQEALFGGTPVDRLRARMRIAPPVDADGHAAPRRKSSSERRNRLTIVPPPEPE